MVLATASTRPPLFRLRCSQTSSDPKIHWYRYSISFFLASIKTTKSHWGILGLPSPLQVPSEALYGPSMAFLAPCLVLTRGHLPQFPIRSSATSLDFLVTGHWQPTLPDWIYEVAPSTEEVTEFPSWTWLRGSLFNARLDDHKIPGLNLTRSIPFSANHIKYAR